MKSGQNEKWSKRKGVKKKSGDEWSKLMVVKIKSGQNEKWSK